MPIKIQAFFYYGFIMVTPIAAITILENRERDSRERQLHGRLEWSTVTTRDHLDGKHASRMLLRYACKFMRRSIYERCECSAIRATFTPLQGFEIRSALDSLSRVARITRTRKRITEQNNACTYARASAVRRRAAFRIFRALTLTGRWWFIFVSWLGRGRHSVRMRDKQGRTTLLGDMCEKTFNSQHT